MKRLIIFLAAVLFAAGTALAQNTEPNQYWQEHFVKKLKTAEGLSFRKTFISENNDMEQDTILQKIGLDQKKDTKYDTVFVSKDSVVVNIHDKKTIRAWNTIS